MSLPGAAVLAGGLATRLGELAKSTPKAMLEVGGRPFIDWQLENMKAQGVERVVMCIGHLAEAIRGHVGDGSAFGIRVDYSLDGPEPLGTGGALRQALPMLPEPFFVLYGDAWLEQPWAPVYARWKESGLESVMTALHNHGRYERSNARYAAGRVEAYDKKAPGADFEHIDYGLNLFTHAAFARAPEGPFDLGELQKRLAAAGQLAGFEVTERFYEIGTPAGLEETRARIARRQK